MDRLIYTAMSGAKHTMERQAAVAHNLANVATPGFRADLIAARAVPAIGGTGLPTRAYAVEQGTGSDLTPGILQATGRDLDVAVNGDGWLTVQTATGEAYTRNGSFEIDANGLLKTRNGEVVLGENGPLTIPENTRVTISKDGTVTGTSLSNPTQSVQIGRLKLVNPAANEVEKGYDGLFRLRSGDAAPASADVKLANGMLETSNVNSVDQLVNMVSAQRQYDFQVRLLQTADQNARSAAQLIAFS
ncbi:flagellar basal-body rod protein FlgF [Andreprevotia lacus DSM 23236]|jgi:flagellar basal-body rod protein FlgF|uniref:Flagellar basal-body rod protein FlgF n=1 Tax=Andreprevotia lacus DSM 23236 TaxID=1121001 RepID=A0A1W1X0A0_9NEIS|nr:flagellar basal-body rod protein FlgF [Andreprevotia lacus]SMC16811.1 flagellar basal-body rod protein FlgF [Andreprevotia lacus DSM 23236]